VYPMDTRLCIQLCRRAGEGSRLATVMIMPSPSTDRPAAWQ
jgi:hypothetical protein